MSPRWGKEATAPNLDVCSIAATQGQGAILFHVHNAIVTHKRRRLTRSYPGLDRCVEYLTQMNIDCYAQKLYDIDCSFAQLILGTYSKADLAAALIYMHCYELVHGSVSLARRHHVTSVVYAGSFVSWPLTQQFLQECFLGETLLLPLIGVSGRIFDTFHRQTIGSIV